MEWHDLIALTQQPAKYDVRYFSTIHTEDELGPSLVALANTKGGWVIIGFDIQNYHLVGTTHDQKWVESLIAQYCNPQPIVRVSTIEKNDKTILVLSVQSASQKPYYFKDHCYLFNADKSSISVIEKEAAGLDELSHLFKRNQEIKGDLSTALTAQDDSTDITEATAETLDSLTDQLLELKNDIKDLPEPVSMFDATVAKTDANSPLNERQKGALQYLKSHQKIQNKTYREIFSVSHKTAHLELVELVEKAYLCVQGSGRNTCYVLHTLV